MALRIIRLEDRIVLDGAITDTSVAVTDSSDYDSEKQIAVDDGHDNLDNSRNDPSDPSDVLGGAPEQAPPIYDVDDPPTPTGYSSVLIINNVDSVDQYLNAANDRTLVLQYSPENTTPQTILESIQAALGNTRVDSIAIAGDTIGQTGMRIFQDMTLSVSTLAVSETQQAFWGQLGAMINEGGNIDLFCDGIAASAGSDFLADQLESISGQTVTINYSYYDDQSGVQESTIENDVEAPEAIQESLAPENFDIDSATVTVSHTDISADNFADEAAAAVFENNSTDLSYGLNIVLVDTALSDYEQLAQSVDNDAVVILYNGETESAVDVLDRVIEYAVDVEAPIDSLSIMSHGKTGEFKLGNEWINTANLNLHSESWQSLNAIMIDGGNIYLYGCNVTADSETGQALLDQLADLTNADVFASNDITGLGGDWDLEAASTGDEAERDSGLNTQIDTTAFAAYTGTLATPVINDDTFSIAENAGVSDSVGTVSASDQDSGATLTYSITAGNATAAFAIDADTGEITVAGVLDRETTGSYSLTVQVSDGTNTDTATITINVTDVNEFTPTINAATVYISESAADGTIVHTVAASDLDAEATLSYTITAGNDDGVFAIDSSTGKITVFDNASLDRSVTSSYSLSVQVSDGTYTNSATIYVYVNADIDSAPVAESATVDLAENSANGTAVHTVMASDADAGDILTYTITGGNTAGIFDIDANTGEITVADNTGLDRESIESIELTVQVSDGKNTDTATITINISDANESAPVADDATVSLSEDAANNTSVHTVVATDADAAEDLTYSITAGNDDGVFAIDPDTGEITVADNTGLDLESTASYALTVQVSDGINTDTATITIDVSDVNEFAPVADDATVSLAENAANNTSVHTVVATDADATADLTYAITTGNDDGVFAIDPDTGEITVADNTRLDFESTASYVLTVQVSDGINADDSTIIVNIEKDDPASSTDVYTEDHTDPGSDSESNDTETDDAGQDDFSDPENEENRDPELPSVNDGIDDVPSTNSNATNSSNDIPAYADGIGAYHAGRKFYRPNPIYGELDLPSEYETPVQAGEAGGRKNGADARIRTELDEVKSWGKDDVGSADLDTIASKKIFFSVAGLVTLVAGYVGWITSGISFLFGFFTSTPLWKSFDPVPIFDEEKKDEDYLDEWGTDPSEVDSQEKGVDTILGDKEP